MAVTHVQTAASASITTGDPGSVGQGITWGSGSDRCGFACVIWSDSATVTCAGSVTGSWTAVASSTATNTDTRTKNVTWFRKTAPTTGAETVTATFTGTANVVHIAVLEFTGVHQTTPAGTPVTASVAAGNTTYSHTVTGGASDDYFVTAAIIGDPTAVTVFDITSSGDDPNWEAAENAFWNTGCTGAILAASGSSHQFDYDFGDDAGSAVSGFAVKKAAVPTAAITGTATASISETDVVSGGKTVIVTLTDDTWVSNTVTPPTLTTDEGTESGNNTAEDPWAVSYPNAATGDLVIIGISWDDSTTTTDVAEPAGPNGETLSEVNATPAVSSNTACRCKVWYTIATGTWTASTLSFNPSATEQWTAAVVVIPAGEFDGTTPIGANTTASSSGVTDTDVLSAAFTAGSTDGDGRLFCWTAANQDPQSLAADWTQIANQDRGIVSGGLFQRDAAVTDSESISSDTVSTIAGDDWCSVSFIVRGPTTTPFLSARQAIIDGLDSAQSEGTGWNAEVRDNEVVTAVARTSDTVVTITLSAAASYNITAQETITVTVPATAVTGGGAITATPTFTVSTAGGGPTIVKRFLLMGVG